MTNVGLLSLPTGAEAAERLAEKLGVPMALIGIHTFPDGELLVTATPAAPRTIIYAPLDLPNDKLVVLLFAAEALRRQGARRLVLVAPYMCYMRQDAVFHPGEAVSQTVIGRLLAGVFDRIVTVDAHLHRIERITDVFAGIEAQDLSAIPAMADTLAGLAGKPGTVIVGPDEESFGWVRNLAERLRLPFAVARKTRRGDRTVDVRFPEDVSLQGRDVILLDDMVSSGGTIIASAKALNERGAANIDVVITHALFDEVAARAFAAAGIRSIRSTDSVPHPSNAISLAGVRAEALRSEASP